MDRRLVPPTFANAPGEYSQRHMQDIIRALNDLVTYIRAPGLGRNTTTTLTNPRPSPSGLEQGTVWNFDGFAILAGLGPDMPLSPSMYGQVSYMVDASIPITTQGQYVSTGITGVLDTDMCEGIGLGVNDTYAIKNITDKTRRVPIYASIDARVAADNQLLGIKLAKNGALIDETECRANQPTAGVEAKLVTRWLVELEPDDEIAVYIANHTNTNDITFKRGRIVVG